MPGGGVECSSPGLTLVAVLDKEEDGSLLVGAEVEVLQAEPESESYDHAKPRLLQTLVLTFISMMLL